MTGYIANNKKDQSSTKLKFQLINFMYRKSNPNTCLDRLWGFQDVQASRFQENRHMKVVRLSAYAFAAFTSKEIFLALISFRGWVESSAKIMSMKITFHV